MNKILITGGCGYIGSHVVRFLSENTHYEIVVVDDLSTGHYESIQDLPVTFYEADFGACPTILETHPDIEGVMHFAAKAIVPDSIADPLDYYDSNVAKLLTFLVLLRRLTSCKHFVFSSTCAVYGKIPAGARVLTEHTKTRPINPYGRTKLMCETILGDMGMNVGILRYFNACGAWDYAGTIGEDHDPETHVIPIALWKAKAGERFHVFGQDYDTEDGTCIRDYHDVRDIASAHVAAMHHLFAKEESFTVNLGTGTGWSVLQVLDAVEFVTGMKVPRYYKPRRAGDPPVLVADATKAREVLGWQAKHQLADSVKAAWAWIEGPKEGQF